MTATQTAADGSFAATIWEGIGSVTCIIVPVWWQGPGRVPALDVLYLAAELDGRAWRMDLHPPVSNQKPLGGGDREVDLGLVPLSLSAER